MDFLLKRKRVYEVVTVAVFIVTHKNKRNTS